MSGVVFEVTRTSPRRSLGPATLYFCCETCAAYYSGHTARVQALRGLPRGG